MAILDKTWLESGGIRWNRRANRADAKFCPPRAHTAAEVMSGCETSAERKVAARAGEEGYVLLGVLFLVFLVLVALSIAAPRMAASIERDREVELQHRAKQYTRAIKMYYKKFGAYPPTLEALEKQNEIRFLRRRYKDPITGKADWKTIAFGQNKMPTAYGFFGQPMAGSSVAGTGPGAAGMGSSGSLFGNSATSIGSTSIGSSNFGSSNTGSSGFGSSGVGSSGVGGSNASGTATGGSTDGSGNSSGTTGDSGSGNGTGGSTTGSTSAGGSTFGSGSAGGGQTFGGAGIIGVESTSPKKAILEYHKKTHFNEWEFVYDPMAEQLMLSNNTNIGTPASGLNSNGVSTPGTFSNQPTNTGVPPQQQQTPAPAPQQ